jgi:hypothetical protein
MEGATGAAFTVKVKVVVLLRFADCPVTVIVELPVRVEANVFTVRVVVHVGLQLTDEKEAVAPVGSPVAWNKTLCVVPVLRVAVTVVFTELPCVTETLPVLDRLKSKGWVTVSVAELLVIEPA